MDLLCLILLLVIFVSVFLWWLLKKSGVVLEFWNRILENQRLRAEAEKRRIEQRLAPLKDVILDEIQAEASRFGMGIKEQNFQAEGYTSAEIHDAFRQLAKEGRIRTTHIGRWVI